MVGHVGKVSRNDNPVPKNFVGEIGKINQIVINTGQGALFFLLSSGVLVYFFFNNIVLAKTNHKK